MLFNLFCFFNCSVVVFLFQDFQLDVCSGLFLYIDSPIQSI